jgi:hypothetical protein
MIAALHDHHTIGATSVRPAPGAHHVRVHTEAPMNTIQRHLAAAPRACDTNSFVRRIVLAALLGTGALVASFAVPSSADAQWSTAYEQYYLPGQFNWTFRTTYPAADRLFNAFDYGHAILYERLYNDAHAPTSGLEQDEYDFITKKLLVSPPRLPLAEAAIEINYAKIAPEAKMMFDWAHLLHRQIYDVLSSESMSQADKDAKIAELVAYYKSRPDLAFSSVPKSMELMEGQPYSLAFRQGYPKFNGLIWGYHWLQVGLYEPLMIGKSQEERQAGVAAAVTRFRQMLENAPEHMPRIMPMTAAIAPTFATRYQEAAIIFDNLHAMHDVVSDILSNDKVPHDQKRAAILEAGSRYRDATSFPMSVAEWSTMGEMMGIENMGGPPVGILPGWPTPTLARGASMLEAMKGMAGMSGMSHGAKTGAAKPMAGMSMPATSMPGMKMDSASGAHAGMQHDAMPGMKMGDSASSASHAGMAGMMATDSAMMRLHARMMSDPVIRERMMADTAMRRMMSDMTPGQPMMDDMKHPSAMKGMPAMSGMPGMMHGDHATAARKAPTARGTRGTTTKPAAKAKKTPVKKPMPGMPGMDMKGMPPMKP